MEALLEAAGISKLAEGKQLADPERLKRITSSVRYKITSSVKYKTFISLQSLDITSITLVRFRQFAYVRTTLYHLFGSGMRNFLLWYRYKNDLPLLCQIRAYPVSHERHADIYVYLYNFYVEGVEGMENDTNNNPKTRPGYPPDTRSGFGPWFCNKMYWNRIQP